MSTTHPEIAATLAEYERLDALSRTRALTDQESRALEAAVKLIYGPHKRRPRGLNIELARRGIKRSQVPAC